MPIVEVPGHGDVEFPDDMSDEQIVAAIQKIVPPTKPQVTAGQRANAFAAGANQGFLGLLGLPMDSLLNLGNLASAGLGVAQSKITGTAPWETFNPQPAENVPFTSAWLTNKANKLPGRPAEVPRPDDMASRYLAASGQAVPAAMSANPNSLPAAAKAVVSTQVPAAVGQTAAEIAPNEPLARIGATMLAQAGTNKAMNKVFPQRPAVPSKADLKKQAGAAYKKAEDEGSVISENSFGMAKQSIAKMLDDEGLDPTLTPDTSAALKRILDTKGPVTIEKLEQLRRIAQNAGGSIKPADQRLAAKTVDAIDDFMDNLQPTDLVSGSKDAVASLNVARDLWKRGRKADTVDELLRRADLSAPNFSASGKENALRTEFRALAKNQKKFKMFSKDEQAAITKVARGGPVENTLRMLGKFAPTGAVSTGVSGGLGFLAGGPAGAVALPAVGGASRYVAKRMTENNANEVSDLVRSGGRLPGMPPMSQEQLRAYLIQLDQQAKMPVRDKIANQMGAR